MAKDKIVKPGDKCPDPACKGKLLVTLTCDNDDCGNTVHPKDDSGYAIEVPPQIKDEGDLCDLILQYAHLLTCYNCGEKLQDKINKTINYDRVGVLHIDPGRNNYPVEPDEPAGAYFECMECANRDSTKKVLDDLTVM